MWLTDKIPAGFVLSLVNLRLKSESADLNVEIPRRELYVIFLLSCKAWD